MWNTLIIDKSHIQTNTNLRMVKLSDMTITDIRSYPQLSIASLNLIVVTCRYYEMNMKIMKNRWDNFENPLFMTGNVVDIKYLPDLIENILMYERKRDELRFE